MRGAMSFAQNRATSQEGHSSDAEAPLQSASPKGEAGGRALVKLGILGSMVLVGVALVWAVAPFAPVANNDLSEAISLYDFTSPYYKFKGRQCPEGERTTKDACKQAGNAVGATEVFGYASNNYKLLGCYYDNPSNRALWNSAQTYKHIGMNYQFSGICTRKPEDMPDFAGMQKDPLKLEMHCLEASDSVEESKAFEHYKLCTLQILAWSPPVPTPAPPPTPPPTPAPTPVLPVAENTEGAMQAWDDWQAKDLYSVCQLDVPNKPGSYSFGNKTWPTGSGWSYGQASQCGKKALEDCSADDGCAGLAGHEDPYKGFPGCWRMKTSAPGTGPKGDWWVCMKHD